MGKLFLEIISGIIIAGSGGYASYWFAKKMQLKNAISPQPLPEKIIPPYPAWDDDWTSEYEPRASTTYHEESDLYYHLAQDHDPSRRGSWKITLSSSKSIAGKRTQVSTHKGLDKKRADSVWDAYYLALDIALEEESV